MGAVFLAEQIAVGNRPVALKVLSRKLLDDPDFLLRFQNEAASTGRIHQRTSSPFTNPAKPRVGHTLLIMYALRLYAQHFCPRVLTLASPGFLTAADIKGNVGA